MKTIRRSRSYARAAIRENRWRNQAVFKPLGDCRAFRYHQRWTVQVLTDNTMTGHRGY